MWVNDEPGGVGHANCVSRMVASRVPVRFGVRIPANGTFELRPPDPDGREETGGWLLALVYDDVGRTRHYAILRAENISDGPVARTMRDPPTPLSFHGGWEPAGAGVVDRVSATNR
jgi:hypothetical protein